MKQLIINVQSFVDIITNSSTEVFTIATSSTIKAVKSLLGTICNLSSDEVENAFTVSLYYPHVEEHYEYYKNHVIYNHLIYTGKITDNTPFDDRSAIKDKYITSNDCSDMFKSYYDYLSEKLNDCDVCIDKTASIRISTTISEYEKYIPLIENVIDSIDAGYYMC